MIAFAFSILFFALAAIVPLSLMYFLVGHMVFNGLSSRPFMQTVLKVSFGDVNVYPLDLFFAAMVLLILFHFGRRLAGASGARIVSKEGRFATVLVLAFFLFFTGKAVAGYFDGVPPQTLIRMFALDAQSLYFFLPVFFLKRQVQLKRVLYFLVFVALLFPFGQLTMVGSRDTEFILSGQGTFRLGYGDSNLFVAIAIIAFFTWERKIILAILPLASLVMLAHRSGFIAIIISLVLVGVLKGKKLTSSISFGLVGLLAGAVLFSMQAMTSYQVFDKGVERIGETFEKTGTTAARLGAVPQTMRVLGEHPLLGLGYGDLYRLQKIAANPDGGGPQTASSVLAFNVLHSHNFLLTSLSHSGVIGTALLLWLIAYGLIGARRLSRMRGKREAGTFLFASLVFFIVFGLMNTSFGSAGFLFWILYGTVFWYFNQARIENVNDKTLGLHPGA